MDTYQAVYDAVRSKVSSFSGQSLQQEIAAKFDISYEMESIKSEFLNVAYEQMRPSVLYQPRIFIDGNNWCALYGDNIQEGVAGFGESPEKAMLDFDKNWNHKLIKV